MVTDGDISRAFPPTEMPGKWGIRWDGRMHMRTLLPIGLLMLGLAGCAGADTDNGLPTAGGTPTSSARPGAASEREAVFAYAKCMRENGVPNFKDPEVGADGELRMDLNADGLEPAVVEAAEKKCKALLPNGGEPQKLDPQRLETLRKYSQCMRDNGLPNFPDPTDFGLQVNGNEFPPDDPKFKAAEEKCRQYAPAPSGGSLTERSS